jgi:hypothetical protein
VTVVTTTGVTGGAGGVVTTAFLGTVGTDVVATIEVVVATVLVEVAIGSSGRIMADVLQETTAHRIRSLLNTINKAPRKMTPIATYVREE